MTNSNSKLWLAALLTLGLAGAVRALPVTGGTSFSKGRSRLSVTGGYASTDEKSYLVLGLGAGYYLQDGLEAGLDTQAWLGSSPHLYTLSPGLRYVFLQDQQVKPYFGGFYKRSIYDNLRPLNSIGGRAGIITALSDTSFLSAGIVYEHSLNCSSSVYGRCNQTYPEVGLSFSY